MQNRNQNYNFKSDQKDLLLKELKRHKSICWYPSAGSDFRPLLYLSDSFYGKHEELSAENAVLPDLFVMTDYQALGYQDYSNDTDCDCQGIDKMQNGSLGRGDILFKDSNTSLTVKNISQFSVSDIEPQEELIYSENIASCYGQGYYMTLQVDSQKSPTKKLGTWEVDVIYLYAENTAFAKTILLQNQINIDYIVRVRYGGGFGWSKETYGLWLYYLADPLNVKYYISSINNNLRLGTGDDIAISYLEGESDVRLEMPQLTPLYQRNWYNEEIVEWYRSMPTKGSDKSS